MSSTRKLGGGRVLGSGRSLSAILPSQAQRSSSLLSPSASSVSVGSSVSTSQPSTDAQDLSSKISLDHNYENSALPNGADSGLFCPICNEDMMNMLQLNRHLDDNHKNLEEDKQDEVKDWFQKQMLKAKRFQPLAVLNQKLKGFDVFEPNGSPKPQTIPSTVPTHEAPQFDPDEIIVKDHWQRRGPGDLCSEAVCGKRLVAVNGCVNCRKCGNLFCNDHTMYQMKLSRSAQHEPVRGLWYRVCETCYKSRDGYNDRNGHERSHTTEFKVFRKRTVDKMLLEVSRLEKRLTKLTQLLANPPPEPPSQGLLWSFGGAKNQRRLLEQSIVTWEDDAAVVQCPFCQQEFSNYTFRKHHCRLCGRVVCSDPATDCSKEIGLNVASVNGRMSEKAVGEISIDVRMCKDCRNTVFSRRDFAAELAAKPPDVRAYDNLVLFERGIKLLLPNFQQLLHHLQDPEKPPSTSQLSDATRVRKRLMDSFAEYNLAARRLRDLPTNSPTQQRLQKAVFQQAANFLNIYMLPLKALPKIMKHAAVANAGLPGYLSPNSRPHGALAAIKFNDADTTSQASSSSAISALEAEEKVLREKLIVLEEQSFLVREQIADANKRRQFDEVSSLARNVEDLDVEINQVQGQLEQLDFTGVYSGKTPNGLAI